jgi:hypothetical protein
VTNCKFGNKAMSTDTAARGIYCSYGTSPVGPGVAGSVFFGNIFQNVKTSLEIDGVVNPALDYVVFPQFATEGSGEMILPLNTSNNGLLVLGGRPAPTGGVPAKARGLLVPAMTATDQTNIGAPEAGRLIFDSSVTPPVLKYWTGVAWRVVATV